VADFISYQPAIAPTWLAREWGESFNLISAVLRDVMISGAKEAVAMGFIGVCADDALPKHGEARVLPRGKGESFATYRTRLIAAFDTWLLAGTAAGVKQAVEIATGGVATIIENFQWVPLPPDGDTDSWWRFWVGIEDTGWHTDGLWDDPGVWDDGGVWDTDASEADIEAVRATIRTWMAAHTICMDIEVVTLPGPLSVHLLP